MDFAYHPNLCIHCGCQWLDWQQTKIDRLRAELTKILIIEKSYHDSEFCAGYDKALDECKEIVRKALKE
jgi:hypothetical protein